MNGSNDKTDHRLDKKYCVNANKLKLITALGECKRISLFLVNICYLLCNLLSNSSGKDCVCVGVYVRERDYVYICMYIYT